MRNNILGGLVIFLVVVTCLLMLDDISSPIEESNTQKSAKIEQVENQKDLAVIDSEEE